MVLDGFGALKQIGWLNIYCCTFVGNLSILFRATQTVAFLEFRYSNVTNGYFPAGNLLFWGVFEKGI
jgi:hypothetical protein